MTKKQMIGVSAIFMVLLVYSICIPLITLHFKNALNSIELNQIKNHSKDYSSDKLSTFNTTRLCFELLLSIVLGGIGLSLFLKKSNTQEFQRPNQSLQYFRLKRKDSISA
jgi:hypothetical protein